MKELIKKSYWLLSIQFGIDPRRMIFSLRGIPRYISDWYHFRKSYKGRLDIRPCLYDWYEEGGTTKNEYFWQDLHVAQQINLANPIRHVDIGSRVDGFVAHVASFREIEVFDIRPITTVIPGVKFKKADLMSLAESLIEYCDSLSCLHALEHFGLGRYGDSINPNGYEAGLANMAGLLRAGGLFYLSVPVGRERVEFNAHRVFNPCSLVKLAATKDLLLQELNWFDANLALIQSSNFEQDMVALSQQSYSLAIFTFIKK